MQLFKNPKQKITQGSVNQKNINVEIDNSKSTIHIDTIPPQESIKIYFNIEE
jgi:hypothetical protein